MGAWDVWEPPGHPGPAVAAATAAHLGAGGRGAGAGRCWPADTAALCQRPRCPVPRACRQRGVRAAGCCGVLQGVGDGEGVHHSLGVRRGAKAGPAAGTPAPGTEGVPRQHTFSTAAVQAAVGKGHLSHGPVGGCIDQALREGRRRGQRWPQSCAAGSAPVQPSPPQPPCRLSPQHPPHPALLFPCPAPAWFSSSNSCSTGCPTGKRRISSMMCTPWSTRTALCNRPSSANTRDVLSRAWDMQGTSACPTAAGTRTHLCPGTAHHRCRGGPVRGGR